MSEHKKVMTEIARQYEMMRDADIVAPGSLAFGVYSALSTGEETASIQFVSLEQLKQMARKYLAKKHDADGEENPAHMVQGELPGVSFSGQLQDRYPIPRKPGEEAAYKRRHLLSEEERRYNVQLLRKSANARQEHADALEAEGAMQAAS